jgi:ComF family protein
MALNILTGIADIIFPPRCAICGDVIKFHSPLPFCENCIREIRFISSPLCTRCGTPFGAGEGNDHLCADCVAGEKHYAIARSMAEYEGTMLAAIHKFKYHGKTGIGKALGNIMADFASGMWDMTAFDLIIPVPLHIRRLRERGFNQAIVLSRPLSRRFKIPLDFSSLKRLRFTSPQVGLNKKERSVNVRGAFSVIKPQQISGKKILLIDDVYTTGSTLVECARVLIDAGALAVAVFTAARATGDHAHEKNASEPASGRMS